MTEIDRGTKIVGLARTETRTRPDTNRNNASTSSLNIDETGWKCKGDRPCLCVFVSHPVVCFTMAASRGVSVLRSETARADLSGARPLGSD